MVEGPLKQAFDLLDTEGVVSRTLTTYRIRNGNLVRENVTRDYSSGDYIDYTLVKPLCKVKDDE